MIWNRRTKSKSDQREVPVHICPECGAAHEASEPHGSREFECETCHFQVEKPPVIHNKFTKGVQELSLEFAFTIFGVLAAILGLKGFLIPNGFIDGGITGISMLLSKAFSINLAYFILLINIPFMVVAYLYFSRQFAIKAGVCIALLAALLPVIDVPLLAHDKIVVALFGGIFLGAGIALSIRGGGVLDGSEVLALIIGKKFPATVGDGILLFNLVLFSCSFIVLSPEQVFYSILTYFSASKTVDFMTHGIESFNGVLITSRLSDQIRYAIVNEFGKAVTVIKSKGGYSEKDQELLFCVLTRLEVTRLQKEVHQIDEKAFTVIFPISDVRGGMIRKLLYAKKIG